MLCLKFMIPPIPQFVTAGHEVWKTGDQHYKRTFGLYDLLLVKRGMLYMTENDSAYAVGPGMLLVLEADQPHWGHLPCDEDTEIYWVHIMHEPRAVHILQEEIPWSARITKGTDSDQAPVSLQPLYIPKYARVDMDLLQSVLDQLNDIHNRLNGGNAIQLHLLLTELFAVLQTECAMERPLEPSGRLGQAAAHYLKERWSQPFDSADMEERLHFQFDYITRCLKKHTGKTPLQYVLHLRLEEAKKLLSGSGLTIPEIAEQIGIPDPNYMTRLFSRKVGLTPGAYRKLQQSVRWHSS